MHIRPHAQRAAGPHGQVVEGDEDAEADVRAAIEEWNEKTPRPSCTSTLRASGARLQRRSG